MYITIVNLPTNSFFHKIRIHKILESIPPNLNHQKKAWRYYHTTTPLPTLDTK